MVLERKGYVPPDKYDEYCKDKKKEDLESALHKCPHCGSTKSSLLLDITKRKKKMKSAIYKCEECKEKFIKCAFCSHTYKTSKEAGGHIAQCKYNPQYSELQKKRKEGIQKSWDEKKTKNDILKPEKEKKQKKIIKTEYTKETSNKDELSFLEKLELIPKEFVTIMDAQELKNMILRDKKIKDDEEERSKL